jgi:hypothetical protein
LGFTIAVAGWNITDARNAAKSHRLILCFALGIAIGAYTAERKNGDAENNIFPTTSEGRREKHAKHMYNFHVALLLLHDYGYIK